MDCERCPNCKKDIPKGNFFTHSAFCSRNLKICRQCNEPVAITDMEKHVAQVSCKACGETMQACDMQSHKTDACSQTEIQCAYCELMLPRADMGEHEMYCGSRTEKCPECSEQILIRNKKLHEESNHKFLKLDDEPGPQPSWVSKEKKKSHKIKKHEIVETTKDVPSRPTLNTEPVPVSRGAIKKRIAPQPPASAGSNKIKSKNPPPSPPLKNMCMYESLRRQQKENRERERENEIRREQDLPELLTSAQKVEKLRKMSALQNLEFTDEKKTKTSNPLEPNAAKNPLKNSNDRGCVFLEYSQEAKDFIPCDELKYDKTTSENKKKPKVEKLPEVKDLQSLNANHADVNILKASTSKNYEKVNSLQEYKTEKNKKSFDNSARKIEFLEYTSDTREFKKLTNFKDNTPIDRFNVIKDDLRALRKELKNCTSPLEVKKSPLPVKNINTQTESAQRMERTPSPGPYDLYKITNEQASVINSNNTYYDESLNNVLLPCEFCDEMIQANCLVAHETGCKPNITSFPENRNTAPPNSPDNCHVPKLQKNKKASQKNNNKTNLLLTNQETEDGEEGGEDEVKIPCEFCFSLIPACRLVWHQEACLISI